MSESHQHDPRRGLLFATLGMMFLSCNFVTVKYSLDSGHGGFNPETLTVIWMGTATFFASLWVIGRKATQHIARPGAALRWLLAVGGANAGAQLMAWQGLQRLDPSFASFLGRFAPMMAIVMGALFLRERIKRLEWLAILIIIGGGALSTLAPGQTVHPNEWAGIALSLGGCFFSAAQWPLAKHCGTKVPGSVTNLFRVSVAGVVVLFWGLFTHKLDFSTARPDQWLVLCGGAFIGPFLSYVMFFRSYNFWDMSRTAVVWTLQPLVVIPLAWLVFHTSIVGWRLVGGFVILGGALFLAVLHRKSTPEPIEAEAALDATT